MNRTALLRSVRSATATIPYLLMPSSILQVRLLAFRFVHRHWHAGTVGVPSLLSAPMMITMVPYEGRERCLMWRLRQAVTECGRAKVVLTLHSVTLSFPAYMNDKLIAPHKSLLRPPKLAPSAWQLYFTDWIQRHQATSTRKLNVAQAAKEAGVEYARLSPEEKEVCFRQAFNPFS